MASRRPLKHIETRLIVGIATELAVACVSILLIHWRHTGIAIGFWQKIFAAAPAEIIFRNPKYTQTYTSNKILDDDEPSFYNQELSPSSSDERRAAVSSIPPPFKSYAAA
mmetsp:Transcript_8548/g.19159  ORF Transcript_8548/g.19159 Transcript_8548/m.19159 type:complete len:110 (+) Transcript_8548:117-446(+)